MSEHEARARAVKATRIADMLTLIGERVPPLNALAFERATATERQAYATCAGVARAPSDETWAIVVAILRDREARPSRFAGLTDPSVGTGASRSACSPPGERRPTVRPPATHGPRDDEEQGSVVDFRPSSDSRGSGGRLTPDRQ